jgi:AraC-like DNA-binding protein
MYIPLQIPYLLSKEWRKRFSYTETIIPELSDYLICLWETKSYPEAIGSITEVAVTDGCIDLIVSIFDKQIIYSGMSKTNFNIPSNVPDYTIGFRFKPGVFHALTGLEATVAIDNFLAIEKVDPFFDRESFFELDAEEMKLFLIDYFLKLTRKAKREDFIKLFDEIYIKNFADAESLYDFIGLSPRQIQRLFKKHYGLSPKMILSIIRFQHCLKELIKNNDEKDDLVASYYDQSHFISDFKKNIGLTPREFINLIK